jgi:hypothetical protein
MTAANDSEPAKARASERRFHDNVSKRIGREGIARPPRPGGTCRFLAELAGCDISITRLSG